MALDSGKILGPAAHSAGRCAREALVTFAFSIPEVAIQRLKSIAITASVNGTKLKSSAYDKAGADLFTAEVPPALLTGDSVKVDFSLDKTIPPGHRQAGTGSCRNLRRPQQQVMVDSGRSGSLLRRFSWRFAWWLLPIVFLFWLYADGLQTWFVPDDFAWLGLLRDGP